MLINQHMHRIVQACYPTSNDEAIELWHDIKPVKFGRSETWVTSASLQLATYQIPEDAAYMIILRTECYVTTFDETASGFGLFSPPLQGEAFWQYSDIGGGSNAYRITPVLPVHILCDSDEMLFAKGDHLLELLASTTAPDAVVRFVRTLVYGYLVGAKVAGRIGGGEATYFGVTDE